MEQTKSALSKFVHIARIQRFIVKIISNRIVCIVRSTDITACGNVKPDIRWKPLVENDVLVDCRQDASCFLKQSFVIPQMAVATGQTGSDEIVKARIDRVPQSEGDIKGATNIALRIT